MLSFKKEHKRKSLSKNKGTACLGVILARACSSRIKTRYCLALWWEAGLPMPNKSFHSPPRPDSSKSERSFPIRFATVPAARVDGHEQTSAFLAPNKEQVGTWTLVFPFLSFHTKKRVTSRGEADNNVLGHGKEERKLSSSFRSLDFCTWYGLWSLLVKSLNEGPKRGDRGTLDGHYHQALTTCAYTHRLGKSEIRYH